MTVHEKARRYDLLLEDAAQFLREVEEHQQKIANVENREEVQQHLRDFGRSTANAAQVGIYRGANWGLSIYVDRFKRTLEGYTEKTLA